MNDIGQLERYLRHYISQIRRIVSKADGVPSNHVFLPLKNGDALSMLNWAVWAKRYNIPLPRVVAIVRRPYTKRRGWRAGLLGAPIRALTGPGARRRVAEHANPKPPDSITLPLGRLRARSPDQYARLAEQRRIQMRAYQRNLRLRAIPQP